MAQFVGRMLDDPQTFTPDQRSEIGEAVNRIIADSTDPDVSGHGSAHYLLTEMAVYWCLAHPDPIPYPKDPDLHI